MTDKVQKIKDWIIKEQDGLMDAQGNFEYPEHEGAYHILCRLDTYIDSLQEEPVSELLNTESMIESYKQRLISQANGMKNSPLIDMCLASYKHGINEILDTLNLSNVQRTVKNCKEPVSEGLEEASLRASIIRGQYIPKEYLDEYPYDAYAQSMFKRGAKWQKENLWKPADGDDLPEVDREVIALLDNGKVVFAHRPDQKGWDAKSIITEKVEHYTPETYGKGGWNIPDVKYWLDCQIPKIEED